MIYLESYSWLTSKVRTQNFHVLTATYKGFLLDPERWSRSARPSKMFCDVGNLLYTVRYRRYQPSVSAEHLRCASATEELKL